MTAEPRGEASQVLLLSVSAEVAGHLTIALQQHQRWARHVGLGVPAELADIAKALASRARQGQAGTPLEDLWTVRNAQVVSPRLVTYADAAALLCVGERTVKRLIAAGTLRPVYVGGSARLRIADLDDYISRLGDEPQTKEA